MPRLFVGLCVPPEAYPALENTKVKFAGRPEVRLIVPKENYHITLKFLGDVNMGALDRVIKDLASVRHAPLDIFPYCIDGFPNASSASVLFVGCENTPELARLAQQIDAATSIISERRRFHPHITIAKAKDILSTEKKLFDGGSFRVDEFILYESRTLATGPVYKVLKRFPLTE